LERQTRRATVGPEDNVSGQVRNVKMRVDKPKKEKRKKPAGWTRLEVDPSSSSSSETLTSSEESDGGGDRDEAKTEKRYHAQLSKQKDPGWKKGSIPIEKY